tara:strand:+ start:1808 stop:2440 length:633 start_codon:yes stop_codon:yes gene_type:complete
MLRAFLKRLNQRCLESSNGERGLILDPEMEKAIQLVSKYANNDPNFKKGGKDYSLRKGLWIGGNFGSGKTQLIKTFKDAKKSFGVSVGFQTCVDMNMAFLKKDEFNNQVARFDGIKTFANKFDKTQRIFDDLGEEETQILDFGNKICIMSHILSERYKGFNQGTLTHITTNLSLEQIRKEYGGRIESRINEMFNVIILGSKADSPDYRKI